MLDFTTLVASYKASADLALAAFRSTGDSIISTARESASLLPNRADTYLSTYPIANYVDGPVFRGVISKARVGVSETLNSGVNEITVGLNIRISNANIDFNSAMELAGDIYNRAVNSADTSEEGFDEAYAAANQEISDYVTDISTQLSEYTNSLSTATTAVISEAALLVDGVFSDWVLDRPLLRYTGRSRIPVVIPGEINEFEIEVANIGRKTWAGGIGVTIKDEYNKQFAFKTLTRVSIFDPGKSGALRASVHIPDVLYVDDRPRSFGKNIKPTIVIITRLA
jgi:hypothetical protein